MGILRVGAELFHADGRTDMSKLIVAFWNSANTPKNAESELSESQECVSNYICRCQEQKTYAVFT